MWVMVILKYVFMNNLIEISIVIEYSVILYEMLNT